jgi:TfoX/Sxy family transcriptional regulator of competence genes
MAYDEDLADRIRELLGSESGVTEKRMFGGLSFLLNGNMAVAASGQGGLLVRVRPDDTEALLEDEHVEPMVMRGREMRGWLRVGVDGAKTKRQLEGWVERGATYAKSLDPK